MSTIVAPAAPLDFSAQPSISTRAKSYLNKPHNILLLILGVVLTVTTIAPLFTILIDTITVHPGSKDDILGTGTGFTLFNWTNLFGSMISKVYFWTPLLNTVMMAAGACLGAIIYGGIFGYLVTRTNLRFKKYLSAIFIFPYIMPQWTLAVVWQRLFSSRAAVGGNDGLLADVFGIRFPAWWVQGLFPSVVVLAMHYAPFAYILIGAIFRNMDANLEEAATILNTPKLKIFGRITLPMITPAILSTILLVFSSAMGSYPVPHYLNYVTLATKYIDLNVNREGQASILAVTMMVFGIALMFANQASTSSRKSYTTVTGKSGQTQLVNLGPFRWILAAIFFLTTLFTSIYPIFAFALETVLPNPGDYSFLKTGDPHSLTLQWWLTDNNHTMALYSQYGILHNSMIWDGLLGTLIVAFFTALASGTIGMLVGYAVSKDRRSKWANYVNSMAFLPYLMPALAVGVAFFVFGSALGLFNTFLLLIIAGTIKYIPFASRASLNSLLQLSGEIEESAVIQNVPWWKRMVRIVIPIQRAAIISGYMLPFMSCMRELTLFMLLCSQTKIITLQLGYYDEMGLYAFSSAINLILIVVILVFNALVNKVTGASLDKGIGGN